MPGGLFLPGEVYVLTNHPCVTSPGHGIAAAQVGQHTEAVYAFTVALELNPREYR